MKIVMVSRFDPNMFPALYQLAQLFAKENLCVYFISRVPPEDVSSIERLHATILKPTLGLASRIPWFRTGSPQIMQLLVDIKPDWIIAQHEYLVPALIYKFFHRKTVRVASHFLDYEGDRKYIKLIKHMSYLLDAHVEPCDVRMGWRIRDWPRLKADTFVIRQAPFRRDVSSSLICPSERTRVVLTGSNLLLKMNRERLARFLKALCGHGISVDWYLPGNDDIRDSARQLLTHSLFIVRSPISKSTLVDTLTQYDVGLFWAPMADADTSRPWDRSVFVSSASNKIGEYIAAGLVVAHTGNPGLSYLPEDVCVAFDPTDPEEGAYQLAAQLADRAKIMQKRLTALRYHIDEMNCGTQAESFVQFIMKGHR